MKRDNRVDGYINLRIKFMDTFSEDWDDDDIIEYIKTTWTRTHRGIRPNACKSEPWI